MEPGKDFPKARGCEGIAVLRDAGANGGAPSLGRKTAGGRWARGKRENFHLLTKQTSPQATLSPGETSGPSHYGQTRAYIRYEREVSAGPRANFGPGHTASQKKPRRLTVPRYEASWGVFQKKPGQAGFSAKTDCRSTAGRGRLRFLEMADQLQASYESWGPREGFGLPGAKKIRGPGISKSVLQRWPLPGRSASARKCTGRNWRGEVGTGKGERWAGPRARLRSRSALRSLKSSAATLPSTGADRGTVLPTNTNPDPTGPESPVGRPPACKLEWKPRACLSMELA